MKIIIKGLKNVNLESISTRKEAAESLSEFVHEFGVQQFLLKNLYWIEKENLLGE